MQFVSIPEQSSPNRPSKHWQCPSFPQDPWPLHVVLGLQNAKLLYYIVSLEKSQCVGTQATQLLGR